MGSSRHPPAAVGRRFLARFRARPHAALTDEAAFDLAWLAMIFMPERTLRALKPGGWIVTSLANIEGTDAPAAFWRLRTTMFGGPMWTLGQLLELLGAKGFVGARALPTPPGAPALVVARKP